MLDNKMAAQVAAEPEKESEDISPKGVDVV